MYRYVNKWINKWMTEWTQIHTAHTHTRTCMHACRQTDRHAYHYITLHDMTLHYITLHTITLHYIHTYIQWYRVSQQMILWRNIDVGQSLRASCHFFSFTIQFWGMCYRSIPNLSFLQQKCSNNGLARDGRSAFGWHPGRRRLVEIKDRRTVEQQVPGVPRRVTDASELKCWSRRSQVECVGLLLPQNLV